MQQLLNLMKSHLFIFAFVVLQIETILFLPFSICMSFISFSCLITMLGLPVSPMLIRSLETGYLCLVPDFIIGRTNAEAEAPILWPSDVKNTGKDPHSGKN